MGFALLCPGFEPRSFPTHGPVWTQWHIYFTTYATGTRLLYDHLELIYQVVLCGGNLPICVLLSSFSLPLFRYRYLENSEQKVSHILFLPLDCILFTLPWNGAPWVMNSERLHPVFSLIRTTLSQRTQLVSKFQHFTVYAADIFGHWLWSVRVLRIPNALFVAVRLFPRSWNQVYSFGSYE